MIPGRGQCFGLLAFLFAILHERLADVGPLRAVVHSSPTPTMSSCSKLLCFLSILQWMSEIADCLSESSRQRISSL